MSAGRRGPAAERAVDLLALARTAPVHFVGINGAGMSALAELVVRSGGAVTGCDRNPAAVSRTLREHGVVVHEGHAPGHVEDASAVVTTAAVPSDHSELVAARQRGIPVVKRAAALGAVVNAGRVIAIAGTHGKSSTTAMCASILAEAGADPTGFVGGLVPEWGGGLRLGGDLYVVEADEFDRSFLTLRPGVALITTVEADHLDIYGSEEAVFASFREFASLLPPDGTLIVCSDDPGARSMIAGRDGVVAYGTDPAATLRAVGVELRGLGSRFRVVEHGETLGELHVGVPGLHNVRNALGAFAAARVFGATVEHASAALSRFHGVARRFQELGEARGVMIVDDYAHHPTEIEATLAAARAAYPQRRIIAVFQPHLYTRTRDFAAEFGRALSTADAVWVTEVYAAREAPLPGITGELVARAARAAGAGEVRFYPALDELPAALAAELEPGDVCITLGAGDIDRIARALLERRQGGVQ